MSRPPFALARHTASILLTQAVVLALRLLGLWLLTVALGEAGVGSFGVVTSFVMVLLGIFSLGVAYANTCFVARDNTRRDELHTTTLVVTVVVSAVVVAGVVTGRGWLAGWVLRNTEPEWLLIGAACFPFALYAFFITGLWTGEERIGRINLLDLLRSVVYVVGLLLLLWVVPRKVSSALWFWAVSFVVAALAAAGILWRKDRVRWNWRRAGFGEALRFSLVAYLGDIASMTHQWLGLFVINHFLKQAAAGAYYLALSLATCVFWMLAGAVRRAGARRVIGSDQAPSWDLVAAMTRVTLWMLVVPGVVLVVASPWLVPMIFPDFEGSVRPLQIVVPGFVLSSCALVLAYYVIGNRRRPGVVTTISWIGLATNVVLSLVLVGPWGVTGVAAAAAVSYSLPFLLLLPVFRRWGHSLGDLFIPRREDLEYFRGLLRHLRGHGDSGLNEQTPGSA
ncbi:MAG: oligosaccharide flippase family protein [Planctomycetes bacterium]|nr:oligosaccharide flippase family protein [Planctomycetota bacterium]